ncbi:P-loop containing nucleoside triphosphate hydrolase protein [Vararia minispora EC-137]|uniref:P-loop containing nucleoside triphosphate hydrolase protein n=1 Tax=Vararia minispora EC-137 TaxID=1314806 RepID=A0ACB8QJ49_9AGAM|nr:P-loop containing nucleoside triphosphate hydrolase protein [Vararia minispora EC-137]
MAQHKVKIAARLRPPIPGEIDDDGVRIEVRDEGTPFVCVTNPRDASENFKYPFTSCYDRNSTQQEIFENDVLPLIDVVYHGSTVTVFAYGVTSSGKTHTMQGNIEQPGVIPRAVNTIFERRTSFADHHVSISMSYFEIYKDECYDLLVDRANAPKLPVREDSSGQVFVANLSTVPISSATQFSSVYSDANKKRSVGSTNLNRASSRSHAILTLEVKMAHLSEPKVLTGKINLVDLAGSENNKLTGNNDPSRMAESAAINTSLSVLGQVVHALNRGEPRIPYRNSKLTRILQDALGGSSVGLLICNLAPGAKFRADTLNTLRFATRTKNVENKPVINEQDTRPVPKAHFSAPPPPLAQLAPLPRLPSQMTDKPPRPPVFLDTTTSSSHTTVSSRPSLAFKRLGPPAAKTGGPSRVPRISAASIAPYPGADLRMESVVGTKIMSLPVVSEQDMDEPALKDRVEAEVAKRIEALEKQRQEEEQHAQKALAQTSASDVSASKESELPSSILAPLLKRHEDLDSELRRRLEELENKYEQNSSHTQAANGLSPVSRKKTGRAYVALARAHSEKGDLQIALDLYRKAESYVPDNVKLKERIIEIEWAVKNNKPFNPSPKRARKIKSRKKGKPSHPEPAGDMVISATQAPQSVDSDDDNTVENLLEQPEAVTGAAMTGRVTRSMKARFGTEATNSPSKRRSMDEDADEDTLCTPPKRLRKEDQATSDNWEPSAPVEARG